MESASNQEVGQNASSSHHLVTGTELELLYHRSQHQLESPGLFSQPDTNEETLKDEIKRICQSQDLYSILGINRDSSEEVIKKAYKKLALWFHPDKCQLPNAEQAIQKISEAYSILSEPDSRQHYDQFGTKPSPFQESQGARENLSPQQLFHKVFLGYANPGDLTMNDLIIDNYSRIEDKINGSELCSHLLQKKLITRNVFETYQKEPDPKKKLHDLLNVLMRRPKQDIPKFLEVLWETRQEHLVTVDKGEKQKDEQLQQCQVQWEQELNPDALGPQLCKEGILSPREYEQLLQLPSRLERNRFLLNRLYCGPVHSFKRFRYLLVSIPDAKKPAIEYLPMGYPAEHTQEQLKHGPETITHQLKKQYKHKLSNIPLIPWELKQPSGQLDQFYTHMVLVCERRIGGEVDRFELKHHRDIIRCLPEEFPSKMPKRVHILGEAGVGKTTLLNRLAMDWAEQADDSGPENLPFDGVFLIRLRAVSDDEKIETIIKKQLFTKRSGIDEGDISNLLQHSEDYKFLFLLDGYDEYRDKCTDLNDIIEGAEFAESTVVLTSRSSRFPSGRCYRDRMIEIKGFDSEDQKTYIGRFFSKKPEMASRLHAKIQYRSLQDLAKIPILLLVLCTLFDRTGDISNNKSILYTELVYFLYDRYKEKFDEAPHFGMEHIFKVIGEIAQTSLLSGNLEFEVDPHDECVKCALELGLLQKVQCENELLRRDREFATFLHKTMQEFCMAWYVVTTGDTHLLAQYCSCVKNILEMESVVTFIFELLRTKATPRAPRETTMSLSSQLKSENATGRRGEQLFHDTQEHVAYLLDCINMAVARDVRREGWTVGDLLQGSLWQVWELLLKGYAALGQAGLTKQDGWTGQVLWYHLPGDKKTDLLLWYDSQQCREPVRPVAVNIGFHKLSLDEYSKEHLTLNPSLTLDTSRLTWVWLSHINLDLAGLVTLTNTRIQMLLFSTVEVKDDDRVHVPPGPCLPNLQWVSLQKCKLERKGAQLTAKVLRGARQLQYLEIDYTGLPGTEEIWELAPALENLQHLHLKDVYPFSVHQALEKWGLRSFNDYKVINWAQKRYPNRSWWQRLFQGRKVEKPDEFQSEGWVDWKNLPLPPSLWP